MQTSGRESRRSLEIHLPTPQLDDAAASVTSSQPSEVTGTFTGVKSPLLLPPRPGSECFDR